MVDGLLLMGPGGCGAPGCFCGVRAESVRRQTSFSGITSVNLFFPVSFKWRESYIHRLLFDIVAIKTLQGAIETPAQYIVLFVKVCIFARIRPCEPRGARCR